MKHTNIIFRCTYPFREVINEFCKEKDISVSDFIIHSCLKEFKNVKLKRQLKRRVNLFKISRDTRELSHNLYFVKNCYSRIMDICVGDLFMFGDVDMSQVKELIKLYEKRFKNMDSKHKKLVKPKWELMKAKLGNKEYLIESCNKFLKLKTFKKLIKNG